MVHRTWIDFDDVNRRALAFLPYIVREWLPDGRQMGAEWVARNLYKARPQFGLI